MRSFPWAVVAVLLSAAPATAGIKLGIDCADAAGGGAKVTNVRDDSPRYGKRMGLQKGDVILKVNDKKVDTARALERELDAARDAIVFWRRGERFYRGGVVREEISTFIEGGGSWIEVLEAVEADGNGRPLRLLPFGFVIP